jgi:hypothetical protein
VIHRRPVALAKLSVHTHHLSLFRGPWRLILFSRPEYSLKIARWTLNINQSINQSIHTILHIQSKISQKSEKNVDILQQQNSKQYTDSKE